MTGKVRVVGKSAGSSAKADAKAKSTQVAAALKTAKSLASTRPNSGTIQIGASGPAGVERFAFFPSKLTVATGATVQFAMSKGSRDVHTATTGPGTPSGSRTPTRQDLRLPAGSCGRSHRLYPSEQPPAVASLTSALHGNGFWNSASWTRRPPHRAPRRPR